MIINTKEYFINKSNIVHENKYEYSEIIYIDASTKIKIKCKEHGYFWQVPKKHSFGNGCPKCGIEKTRNSKFSNTENFINKSIDKHNNYYNYSNVDYIKSSLKVEIICPKHGSFQQTPNNHLQGQGCLKCANKDRNKNTTKSLPDFINESNIIHDNKYSYFKSNYKNANKKITIICPEHGDFQQTPSKHLLGRGCSKCGKGRNISKPEVELQNYIKSLKLELISNKKTIIKPYELDIFIPELNKAIEFNGMYWHYDHSNKNCKPRGYHAMKSNLCREKGIKLLHVREDLWKKDKNKMKQVIKNFINDQ